MRLTQLKPYNVPAVGNSYEYKSFEDWYQDMVIREGILDTFTKKYNTCYFMEHLFDDKNEEFKYKTNIIVYS